MSEQALGLTKVAVPSKEETLFEILRECQVIATALRGHTITLLGLPLQSDGEGLPDSIRAWAESIRQILRGVESDLATIRASIGIPL